MILNYIYPRKSEGLQLFSISTFKTKRLFATKEQMELAVQNPEQLTSLAQGPTAEHWKRIGIHDHHGFNLPLFALRSVSSCGIGEYPDLLPIIDWCAHLYPNRPKRRIWTAPKPLGFNDRNRVDISSWTQYNSFL